jgi:hypothetical protein
MLGLGIFQALAGKVSCSATMLEETKIPHKSVKKPGPDASVTREQLSFQ